MAHLFCFGLGYSAEHFLAAFGAVFTQISGTVRSKEKARRVEADGFGGRKVFPIVFDGEDCNEEVGRTLATADAILVSIQPDANGDPVLRCFAEAIARSPAMSIVYLSTVGVYGDHDGAWVDETTPAKPLSPRSRERLEAEQEWRALAAAAGKRLAILRLAGIYGPGQNALVNVMRGSAKRIIKPGQVFNRIHVFDIAQSIDASFARRADGLFNVADDEPSAGHEVVAFAAALLGAPAPPEIEFEEAAKRMSPMALSFYGEVKRVANAKLKRELGVQLRYPTYREGIRALFEAGGGA